MFNNLIESSSHLKEFKRRGSFLLFTTATYLVLFVITGVVSIYAYDARLEQQTLEMVITMVPVEQLAAEQPKPKPVPDPPDGSKRNNGDFDIRRHPEASVNQPNVAPDKVSTAPNPNPPVRTGVRYVVGDVDSNTIIGSGGKVGGSGSSTGGIQVAIPDIEPPPAPTPAPVVPKIVKAPEVLNSKAIVLPKPPYPITAKSIRLQGTVAIQVLIDEAGKVVSAKVVSGHPLLIGESQRAAMQARFSPTTINGKAVKVSGVIMYNFVLPN
jgi:periplasmic protein TonB